MPFALVSVATSALAAAGVEVVAVVVVATFAEIKVAAEDRCSGARAWCKSLWKRDKKETWL